MRVAPGQSAIAVICRVEVRIAGQGAGRRHDPHVKRLPRRRDKIIDGARRQTRTGAQLTVMSVVEVVGVVSVRQVVVPVHRPREGRGGPGEVQLVVGSVVGGGRHVGPGRQGVGGRRAPGGALVSWCNGLHLKVTDTPISEIQTVGRARPGSTTVESNPCPGEVGRTGGVADIPSVGVDESAAGIALGISPTERKGIGVHAV